MLSILESNIKELYKYGYAIVDKIFGYPFQKRKFYKRHGYKLNLQNPKTFNEKTIWKKIYDRNPTLPITADKYRVRQYLIDHLGEKKAQEILIPLLYVTDNPKTIPFDSLPNKYIIKTNFGSGQNLIVNEKTKYTKKEIIDICTNWLRKTYGVMYHEWAYQSIERKIVIEKLLIDENGDIPKDFKFFIFKGRCEMVQVDFDRYKEHTRTLYTADWEIIPATLRRKQGKDILKPSTYDKMLQLAELIGKNFDFVRIDLYTMQDKIYFGEMTHYPGSGMEKFTPQSYDIEFGHKWIIEPEYWKKERKKEINK